MKKLSLFKKIVGGISLTSAMFIFQACYGTPQDYGRDTLLEGKVVSEETGVPLSGVKVSVAGNIQYEYTDADGKFSMYTENIGDIKIVFEDENAEDGTQQTLEKVITSRDEEINMEIAMK